MPDLFKPWTIGDVTFRNRIFVSPMCQYSADDGYPNDWHFVHLGSRAVGGAGLVMMEATAVTPEGRITPGDLGIWSDDHVAEFKRNADFIHAQGGAAGVQLAHAGRKASCAAPWVDGGRALTADEGAWQTVAPSAIPFSDNAPTPHALTADEMQEIVDAFVAAARRADAAGMDMIEVHGAHGYLLHEFVSPLSNQRTDEYGGSLENRCRFPLEVVRAVRAVWPENKPLFYRVSASDWEDGGWDIDQTVQLAQWLKAEGVDVLDCSGGGNTPSAKIPVGPGYQTEFAARVRRETGLATGAVGMITEPVQAEHIVHSGQADCVLLARELLRDPYFPLRAAAELHGDDNQAPPVQYARAFT
ncbi:NADH:flavin oxidoreductase/NADH oxidase [Salinisphaera hydrothermalis]|uniref:NADH:flavin oxidoreductase n=1 Tax=Salinisphaera hydrothermalis (strain C41B8) TaxID=1304275 RepID=A0A084IIU7_SALHC|nr:NADH:flavin oxidoreductase/NADH oxidase [Salinisphaera hydrothermalis]KEZ76631.1 NADH:flavin oxidoreductase [Salinisphaera hydrothermalis C41B8]